MVKMSQFEYFECFRSGSCFENTSTQYTHSESRNLDSNESHPLKSRPWHEKNRYLITFHAKIN